ncbi:PAS domain-containing protein [Flavobacterium branchiicola]|uniref:histidine kinase n=1 Tax=Flavobacterium branchiicola TaxID=1114875 RepID=A0ABV9P8L4_9FLAO|nr:PAS domain-containing protein [Flavobacterium branchiicola]MBS7253608.1 PAS domain-containing protein [Flavobacterium branchiicola]
MELSVKKISTVIKSLLPKSMINDIGMSSKAILETNRSLSFKLNDSFITDYRDEIAASRIYDERSRIALEASATGIWDWDVTTNVVYYSAEALKILGLNSKDVFDKLELWDRALHPEDLKKYYWTIDNHLDGKTSFIENQHRVLTSDGKYKWILTRGKVIKRDTNGKALRVAGTHTDIYFQKERQFDLIKKVHYLL